MLNEEKVLTLTLLSTHRRLSVILFNTGSRSADARREG